MTKQRMAFNRLILVQIFMLALFGCKDRYFSNEAKSIQYFETHRKDFEQLAESWAVQDLNHIQTFCNFAPGNYRWGNTFIRQNRDGFSVETSRGKENVSSLMEAESRVNAPSAQFSHCVDLTSQLKIYCIEDGDASIVQILLKGSEWSPYGFRYAPKASPSALGVLESSAKTGKLEITDTKIKQMSERWFYFEGRR